MSDGVLHDGRIRLILIKRHFSEWSASVDFQLNNVFQDGRSRLIVTDGVFQDGRSRLIVTDGVFSMDGNVCPLPQIKVYLSGRSKNKLC